MAETILHDRERSIAVARAALISALASVRQELKPTNLASRAKQSAMAAIAPAVDPLVRQTKSASGWIVLAGSAAAMVFALGRSSVPAAAAEPAAQPASAAERPPADVLNSPAPKPAVRQSTFKSILNSALLAGGGIAAGAFLASRFPLTQAEKQHGAAVGRELGDMAKSYVRGHSVDALKTAVNSFGITRSAGTLLAILAAVSAAGNPGAGGKRA